MIGGVSTNLYLDFTQVEHRYIEIKVNHCLSLVYRLLNAQVV